jgi:hypothetical protein
MAAFPAHQAGMQAPEKLVSLAEVLVRRAVRLLLVRPKKAALLEPDAALLELQVPRQLVVVLVSMSEELLAGR